MIRRRLLRLPVIAFALVLLARAAWAAPLPPPRGLAVRAGGQRAEATARRPGIGGWRAFVDPLTGKLREPTREEALALSRASAQRPGEPVIFEIVTHPDGTRSVDLRDAFEMQLVARRNPDGSISMECVRSALGEGRTAKGDGSGDQRTVERGGLSESNGISATKPKEK